jgi:hypothetical protein
MPQLAEQQLSITPMKPAARFVGTHREEPSHRPCDKAAEIIRKHNLPLLGDFLACRKAIFGYFSRSPLNTSPPTLGGPPSS